MFSKKKEKKPSEEGSSENDESFSVSLSDEEKANKKLTYDRFISSVKLFLMTEFKTIDDKGFIEYYSKRGFLDENNKPIIANYKKYVREWIKTHTPHSEK